MSFKYLYGHDDLVAEFVVRLKLAAGARAVGFPKGRFKAVGVLDQDGELIAGMVYYNFNPESGTIDLSVEALPGKGWMTPTTLAVMFRYPFIQCGCQMVMTKTGTDNKTILKIMKFLNFKFIRIPRLYGRDEDGMLCSLTDDDWKASKTCRRYQHHLLETEEKKAA